MSKNSYFEFNAGRGDVRVGSRRFRLPRRPSTRIALGAGLIAGGTLGFLPVLGFWMIPLGLLVLSQDLPAVRRRRRQFVVWMERRRAARSAGSGAAEGNKTDQGD